MLKRAAELSPTRIYYIYVGFSSLAYALAATLQLVYQVKVIGLSPFQLVIVGTVLEATVFLFEVPTGVIADRYSRRLSIIVGAVLSGAGFLVQGLFHHFWAALACSLIWGIGWTCISGAGLAWLVDEIGADSAQPALTRARQLDLAVTIVGAVLAGLIGLAGLGYPLVAAGITFLVLALFLLVYMPERGFTPTPPEERESYGAMAAQLRTGVTAIRVNRIVLVMVLVSLFVGLSSEAVDRLWTDRILNAFALPSIGGHDGAALWFTIFALVGNLISLAVSLTVNRVSPKTVNNLHPNLLMATLMLLQVVGILVLGIIPILAVAMVGLWIREASRDLAYPIQTAWMNRNLETGSRATVLSMSSQVDAFGQVVGGPSLGAVGSRMGLSAALAGSAIVLSPAVLCYLALRRLRPAPDAVPDEQVGALE